MANEITVHVVKYPDRTNLMMRYVDPITGKQVTRSTGTAKQREAYKVAAKWEAELCEGRYKKPSKATWREFREKYEAEVLPGLALNTELKVSGIFNSVERILNPFRVSAITSARLSYLVRKLRERDLAETTIAGYLSHTQSALKEAVEWGYIDKVPKMPKLHRGKCSKVMKGRPITNEEFERMLAAVDKLPRRIEADGAADWKFYLRGLWLSGLRLSESLCLYWDEIDCAGDDCLEVQLHGRRPLLVIPAAIEKGNEDRLLPMAPEFAELLHSVPENERCGPVFQFKNRRTGDRGTLGARWVSRIVCEIGGKAGILVNSKTNKTASAHDLRRSFGQRWAARVTPQILMQLMRHADINTTLKYYVGAEAEATADVLWDAIETEQATAIHAQ